ncbi:MAG: 2-oxoacid:acceptor oxidoreductase subunit alpha [Desulfurococcales archaeon]|nr:2-oxoacid:acceptor oxidoreductase subunit alpha [Desulfurococcales archaeon]
MARRMLLSGNEAIVYGALDAGCRFYAGYPITPSSEIMHLMAKEMPRVGGVFIQAEDELAAINMVIGASWGGLKSMTATSGPGLSLMQEGIGYAVMTETPLVIVDVMRTGPATGQATKPAQGDLMQARWGRHGDQYLVVLAAQDPQEAYDLVIEAFNIAEELRTPVILLIDEFIGHGREVVVVGKDVVIKNRRLPPPSGEWMPFDSEDPRQASPMPLLGKGYYVLVTGSTHNEYGYRDVHSFETHYRLVKRIKEKIIGNLDKMPKPIVLGKPDDAETAIVCFGSVCRSAREAFYKLRERGFRMVFVRLRTLWPLDYDHLSRILDNVEAVIVPELSLGQLIHDVREAVDTSTRVIGVNKVGGGLPIYPSEIIKVVKEACRK